MNFVKYFKFFNIFSALLLISSLFIIFNFGLNFGIDFKGGSVFELEFEKRPENPEIEKKLADLNLGELVVQQTGKNGIILRTKEIDEGTHQQILSRLAEISEVKELSFENIGPTVGKELRKKTIFLIIFSLIFLFLYIVISFLKISYPLSNWQCGLITIITLSFDILLTIGFFSLLGKFFNAQFNIPIVTALLTILGYTINDKIIIFDRIRENILKRQKGIPFKEIVNLSLNQTIFRSLSTGTCSLLVLIFISIFGGETLKYFSLTLIFGILVGTYSSLFLATPIGIYLAKES
jgi:preprotein translocase subunit SecF